MAQLQIGLIIPTILNTIQMGYQFNMGTRGYLKLGQIGQYALAQGGRYDWIFLIQ